MMKFSILSAKGPAKPARSEHAGQRESDAVRLRQSRDEARRVIRCLAAALGLALACSAWAQAEPGWEAARKAIIADYAKQQPGDKVQEGTGPDKREAILIAVRYYGSALVQRAAGSRAPHKGVGENRVGGRRRG